MFEGLLELLALGTRPPLGSPVAAEVRGEIEHPLGTYRVGAQGGRDPIQIEVRELHGRIRMVLLECRPLEHADGGRNLLLGMRCGRVLGSLRLEVPAIPRVPIHQWSTRIIKDHQGSSRVIKGHQGSSRVIKGHQGYRVVMVTAHA